MEPLRVVEIIPVRPFGRTNERHMAPPVFPIPSREASEAYIGFLDSLEPLERQVLVGSTVPHTREAGRLAEELDFDDIEVTEIGLCGSEQPYLWKSSAKINTLLEDLALRWGEAAKNAGVLEQETPHRAYEPGAQTQLGFTRMLSEVIYGNYDDGSLTEDPHPHIREIMMDTPRMEELVGQWYDENYALRMVRVANVGEIATSGFRGSTVGRAAQRLVPRRTAS